MMHDFAEVRKLLKAIPSADQAAIDAWKARDPQLTKPLGSLGQLEDVSCHMAAWQRRHPPRADHIRACIFAGNHGIASLGVSAFPADVTVQMVANYQNGGAAINQICKTFGVEVITDSIELDRPTADFTKGPAMTESECVAAMERGAATVEEGLDLLVLGEVGIGNTTCAAAISHALFGGTAADWTGRGTGVDNEHLAIKTEVVRKGVLANPSRDPLEVLRSVGGRELAAMTGAVLAARLRRVPVLLDGYVCLSAAVVLYAMDPKALDHCLIGHASAEPGDQRLVATIGKKPLLTLNMRLGEGTGAAAAVGLVKAAVACHNGMATFAEAGVSEKD